RCWDNFNRLQFFLHFPERGLQRNWFSAAIVSGPPSNRRGPATLASADDAFVDEIYVRLQIALLHHLARFAAAALEQHAAGLYFGVRHAREFDPPEVHLRVQEGHSVGIASAVSAELANDADHGLFVRIHPAED